jgi:hypothetical protein
MSELRAFATANNIAIAGDKRLKASYQSAINAFSESSSEIYTMSVSEAIASYNEEYLASLPPAPATPATPATSKRTAISAAVPLIVMLGIAIKLVLWFLDVSIHTARFVKCQVRRTVAGRATKAYLTRVWVDASQYTNGLLYGI